MNASLCDENFIEPNDTSRQSLQIENGQIRLAGKHTKKQMLELMSKIMDKDKPLFVFNAKCKNSENGTSTPSFLL